MNKPTPVQFILFLIAAALTYALAISNSTPTSAPTAPAKSLDKLETLNFDLK